MVVHDNFLNANEWSTITGLLVGLVVTLVLPKRFPRKASFVFFFCGVYSGFIFDNSLTINPFDFYDVNDTSDYEVMDYILYLAYGPVSYLFFYMFDYIRLKLWMIPAYLFAWVLMVLELERLGTYFGVFHYVHGYGIEYSIVIYLVTFSLWSMLYAAYRYLLAREKL